MVFMTPLEISTRRSTSQYDSVDVYLRSISGPEYEVLTREQEIELGLRNMRGDEKARQELFKHNLKLAFSIAGKYVGGAGSLGITFPELIVLANDGLKEVIPKFNPEKGKFSTYACWYIRKYILQALEQPPNFVVKLPRRNPNSNNSHIFPSLDEPISEDGTTFQGVMLDENARTPYQELERQDTTRINHRFLEMLFNSPDSPLDEGEKTILRARCGLVEPQEPQTFRQIAPKFNRTPEWVRQTQERALQKARDYYKELDKRERLS